MNRYAAEPVRTREPRRRASIVDSAVTGVFVGVLSLLYYLSYASLIFSGPLSVWLGYGLTATVITGVTGGLLTAWRGSLPFAIGGPDGATSAIVAAMVGSLSARLVAMGAAEHLFVMIMLALTASAALTGVFMFGLGLAKFGRAIRYIPYPVMGGFLGGSGCLVIAGTFKVLTGHGLSYDNIGYFLGAGSAAKVAAGALVAAFLIAGRRYWSSPIALPVMLLIGALAFHAVLWAGGFPLAEAQVQGWMFVVPSARAYAPPWSLSLTGIPWSVLPGFGAEFVAVTFVSAISLLLNTTSLEMISQREASLDRDLKVQGGINLLSAVLGGYVSCITVTRSKINFSLGNAGRTAGLVAALVSAAALFVSPDVLSYVPKCVLAGLLVTIGYDILQRWLIDTARQLEALEYLSLLAIALIIFFWGFLAGVAIGVVFGCATFALSAGRINVIKFAFDGTEYLSSLDRGPHESAILAAHGRDLQGLRLQSYLFFGSANRLYEYVKTLLAHNAGCRFLLFDFRLVTGIDSSAVHSFSQIKRAADAVGATLVLVNLTPHIEKAFTNNRLIGGDVMVVAELDRALEICENVIIAAHSDAQGESRSLADWLGEALDDAGRGRHLAEACRRCEFAADDIIAQQGAPSDSMHFIVEGRVGVIVHLDGGSSIRVRSLGPQTTVGEMGMLTGRERTATVRAEAPSVAYELTAEAFEKLKAEDPELVQRLLTYVIAVMAERLGFASRLIGVLQR